MGHKETRNNLRCQLGGLYRAFYLMTCLDWDDLVLLASSAAVHNGQWDGAPTDHWTHMGPIFTRSQDQSILHLKGENMKLPNEMHQLFPSSWKVKLVLVGIRKGACNFSRGSYILREYRSATHPTLFRRLYFLRNFRYFFVIQTLFFGSVSCSNRQYSHENTTPPSPPHVRAVHGEKRVREFLKEVLERSFCSPSGIS